MGIRGYNQGEDSSEPSRDSSSDRIASAKRHQIVQFESPIRFTSWRDVNIESLGYDPRSSYVEKFWLPFLGPSTVFMIRRVTELLESEPYGFALALEDFSIMLGLGANTNKHSSVQKTLNRLLVFELARIMPSKAVSVRLKLPPLPQRYLNRLSSSMRLLHEKETKGEDENGLSSIRARARSLALTLSRLGHDRSAIERQLLSWRFHPSICFETLSWIDSESAQQVSPRNELGPTRE